MLVATALAACGGESDEEQVVEVVEVALTKTDPENCTELETQSFVEQWMQIEDPSAVRWCKSNAEAIEHDLGPVTVHDVEVEGPEATAEVGGLEGYEGTMTVALVEQDGHWKLDEIVRYPRLDREAFLENVEKGLESGESRPTPEAARCILATYAGMSRRELEALVHAGNTDREIELYRNCGRRGS